MRVLWLAVADARGHLMRAHLCRRALAAHGIEVDIVTTSDAGVAFAEAMGSPARVDFDDWRVEFDGAQCLDRRATHRRAVRYVVDPGRMLADLAALRRLDYDLFVNDFHPLLLWDRPLGGATPVVHVHGEHLWSSVAHPFRATRLASLDRVVAPLFHRLRAAGDAVIVHRPGADHAIARSGSTFTLPPIIASPTESRAAVRDALGLEEDERLAVAYLNPYFRDPRLAEAIESACDRVGVRLYGVAEGFADRPRWRRFDDAWVDKVAAADVLIAPPGMGSVGLHQALGVPFLMLLTDQPEQRANAAATASSAALATEFGAGADLLEPLSALLGQSRVPKSRRVDALWAACLAGIAAEVSVSANRRTLQRNATSRRSLFGAIPRNDVFSTG